LQVYGTDKRDSKLYDMLLHIDRLSVDDAVDIISKSVQKPAFQATPESHKLVEYLALAARVKATLAEIAPNIQVEADHGTVYIGRLNRSRNSATVDSKLFCLPDFAIGYASLSFT
jgi:hypothetical protein